MLLELPLTEGLAVLWEVALCAPELNVRDCVLVCVLLALLERDLRRDVGVLCFDGLKLEKVDMNEASSHPSVFRSDSGS